MDREDDAGEVQDTGDVGQWLRNASGAEQLRALNAASRGTMFEALDMRFREASPDRVVLSMPVRAQVKQQLGVLHGGATAALAEGAASVGTWLAIDHATQECYGLEISCNHLRSKREGTITATASPLHRGRSHWLWDIRVEDESARLIAVARCTVAIVPRRA